MKNEAGDKSPNEAALSVLIEGEALTLDPLRSTARGVNKLGVRRVKSGVEDGLCPYPFRYALRLAVRANLEFRI